MCVLYSQTLSESVTENAKSYNNSESYLSQNMKNIIRTENKEYLLECLHTL